MASRRPKRLRRLLSLGALIATVAALRNRKLNAEEAKFKKAVVTER
jgi:hypothetical protein